MIDLDVIGVVERPETPAQVVMDSALRGRAIRLTCRQRQICMVLSEGHDHREVAHQLGLTHATVKVYVTRMREKCDLSRADLVLIGLALRLHRAERATAA